MNEVPGIKVELKQEPHDPLKNDDYELIGETSIGNSDIDEDKKEQIKVAYFQSLTSQNTPWLKIY